jgi:Rieske Fe-S protein
MSYVIGAVGAAITTVVGVPLIGYFLSPAWKKADRLVTPIARTSDIPIGQPTFVTYEERVRDGWYISTRSKGSWIVTKDGKEFVVFDPRCTHLNCPYYWNKEKQKFECPCHDGGFDINGNVLHGPPPRPLDRLEFTIVDGLISITGGIIPRR